MWRIIDANLNRLREGLRVLEDVARFALNNPNLFYQLRGLRHELGEIELKLGNKGLVFRDALKDIGAEGKSIRHQDLISFTKSNAHRCQEALRVLEECSRLPNLPLDGGFFKSARFKLYQLEKEIVFALSRKEKSEKIKGLYVILDAQLLEGRGELEAAREIIRGGARIIQLRDKRREKGDLLPLSIELKKLCQENDCLFIINDHLDLALLSEADGLHLGQKDIPLSYARKLLPDKIIGISVHNIKEAEEAQAGGADYISVGSVFATSTKQGAEVVGLGVLREIVCKTSLPVVAIGGINKDNIEQVIRAGVVAVAVASAVLKAQDIEASCREITSYLK